jgi:hypothetical protein
MHYLIWVALVVWAGGGGLWVWAACALASKIDAREGDDDECA